ELGVLSLLIVPLANEVSYDFCTAHPGEALPTVGIGWNRQRLCPLDYMTERTLPPERATAAIRWFPVSARSRKSPSTVMPPGSWKPSATVLVLPSSRSISFTLSLKVSAT